MPTGVTIRLLTPGDAGAFGDHLARHKAESGTGGRPIFSPTESLGSWGDAEKNALIASKWSLTIGEGDWERAFGAFVDGVLIGHSDLRSRGLPSTAHRALFGLGVESGHWRRGIGRALLAEAVRYAREETALAWVDLGVFAHNAPAVRLYQEAGFVETGRVSDLFRVFGQKIDDIQMTLRLH